MHIFQRPGKLHLEYQLHFGYVYVITIALVLRAGIQSPRGYLSESSWMISCSQEWLVAKKSTGLMELFGQKQGISHAKMAV